MLVAQLLHPQLENAQDIIICCNCAANEESKVWFYQSSPFSLVGVFFLVHRSEHIFTWSTEVGYLSPMFQRCWKALSALITVESMFILCSSRLAHYHKHKLHIIPACDVTLSDWTTKILAVDTRKLYRQLSRPFPSMAAVQRSKGRARETPFLSGL